MKKILAIIIGLSIALAGFTACNKNNNSSKSLKGAEATTTKELIKYYSGYYEVGTDIPAGEYVLFSNANGDYSSSFSVSDDSDNLVSADSFTYNSIISIYTGQHLSLAQCYAVPISENPNVKTDDEGMFKVGVHLNSGKYKIEATKESGGFYIIFDNSSQKSDSLIETYAVNGQRYINVSNGQYLLLHNCKIVNQ